MYLKINLRRKAIQKLVSTGKAAAYKIKHANILLNIDANGPGWTDSKAAVAFSCHRNTVVSIRKRFVQEGLEAVLTRKKMANPSRKPFLCDGESEAKIIALRPLSTSRRS
ncbi:MAG: helix-turn-helix domain-containing protein [Oscillatoria sp. SIO1A7]|nr:helix-turn-helix domain-containing protein [Oscillatoria sp. SIO1A7]NER40099.1 helix-turn-helix domain-containing protein [Oscillatoria sp. SIO1A7]